MPTPFPRRGRLAPPGAAALATVLAVACGSDPPTEPVGELQTLDPAADWVGEYRGTGEGLIDGEAAVVENAVLTIAFDAAPDASPTCEGCVTISLDDDFLLTNVMVTSLTELDLSYLDGVVLYTLSMRRRLLGVDNPNLVLARLTIGNWDAPVPIVDLEYVLNRP